MRPHTDLYMSEGIRQGFLNGPLYYTPIAK